jgi:ferredoxin like protein
MSDRIFTSIEDKLGLDKFTPFEKTHLKIKDCPDPKKLVEEVLFVCPAKVYTLNEKGEAIVSFENCLECGTCRIVAPDMIDWDYPQGGFGITYRYG